MNWHDFIEKVLEIIDQSLLNWWQRTIVWDKGQKDLYRELKKESWKIKELGSYGSLSLESDNYVIQWFWDRSEPHTSPFISLRNKQDGRWSGKYLVRYLANRGNPLTYILHGAVRSNSETKSLLYKESDFTSQLVPPGKYEGVVKVGIRLLDSPKELCQNIRHEWIKHTRWTDTDKKLYKKLTHMENNPKTLIKGTVFFGSGNYIYKKDEYFILSKSICDELLNSRHIISLPLAKYKAGELSPLEQVVLKVRKEYGL